MSDQHQIYSQLSIYSPTDSRPRPLSPRGPHPDSMSSLSSLGAPGFDDSSYLLPLETPRYVVCNFLTWRSSYALDNSLDQCARPLLPAFSSRQYNQLPTPQRSDDFLGVSEASNSFTSSPNNFAPYIGPRLQPSPLHHGHVAYSGFTENLCC